MLFIFKISYAFNCGFCLLLDFGFNCNFSIMNKNLKGVLVFLAAMVAVIIIFASGFAVGYMSSTSEHLNELRIERSFK